MMKEFSMHILDIAQNSIRAEAQNVTVAIDEDLVGNRLSFYIEDNGTGMSAEVIEKVRDPFTTSRSTRKVGLGIPFLEQTCIQCGGGLDIESVVGEGTKITATLDYDSIDRPPMGDIAGCMHILFVMNPDIDFRYIHKHNGQAFEIGTAEIKEVLDGVPLSEPSVMEWIKENIVEGLADIGVGGNM